MTIYDIICSDPVFYTGFLFIISVPGLYVALNKNLVCPVFSSSCTYAFRAFLFCPVFGAVNLVLCLIVFTPLHFCEIAFNSPVIFFCSMMISVLLILYSLSFLLCIIFQADNIRPYNTKKRKTVQYRKASP